MLRQSTGVAQRRCHHPLDTVYLERAITALRSRGIAIEDEALAHLSPIGWEHVKLTGDYNWQGAGRLPKGKFRPLRPFVASTEA
jgi:hypothetical protein